MIVFDLACSRHHIFEAWFGSSADYDDQRARGLVACPICGAQEVGKAAMAPNVAPKGNRGAAPVPVERGRPAEVKAMLAALARMQTKMLEGSEHVGRRFATEARAIHDGDAPERQIHGLATPAEAEALIDDGVAVMPLPLPVVPPEISH